MIDLLRGAQGGHDSKLEMNLTNIMQQPCPHPNSSTVIPDGRTLNKPFDVMKKSLKIVVH